jgi:hypothetical protein
VGKRTESSASAFRAGADALERAVRTAHDSDHVVVIVGTSDLVESEGYDRTDLELPDGQNELIKQILEANPQDGCRGQQRRTCCHAMVARSTGSVAGVVWWAVDG